jgi:hypothetical protein
VVAAPRADSGARTKVRTMAISNITHDATEECRCPLTADMQIARASW